LFFLFFFFFLLTTLPLPLLFFFSFLTIDELCEKTQRLIEEYPLIREVNTIRVNLMTTKRSVYRHLEIPDKVNLIKKLLEEDDSNLLKVHAELLLLERTQFVAIYQVSLFFFLFHFLLLFLFLFLFLFLLFSFIFLLLPSSLSLRQENHLKNFRFFERISRKSKSFATLSKQNSGSYSQKF
jgi:hypothetical protein